MLNDTIKIIPELSTTLLDQEQDNN